MSAIGPKDQGPYEKLKPITVKVTPDSHDSLDELVEFVRVRERHHPSRTGDHRFQRLKRSDITRAALDIGLQALWLELALDQRLPDSVTSTDESMAKATRRRATRWVQNPTMPQSSEPAYPARWTLLADLVECRKRQIAAIRLGYESVPVPNLNDEVGDTTAGEILLKTMDRDQSRE